MKFLIAIIFVAIYGSVFADDDVSTSKDDKKNVKRGVLGLDYGGGYGGYGSYGGNYIGHGGYNHYGALGGYSGIGTSYGGYSDYDGLSGYSGHGLGYDSGYTHSYPVVAKVYSGYGGLSPYGYSGNYNGHSGGYYGGNSGYYASSGSHYPYKYNNVGFGHGIGHSYY